MDYANHAAIVTGGASGLGGATAKMLAAKGCKVAIFDLNEDAGQAAAAEIGGRYFKVNVADDASAADAIAAAFGVGISHRADAMALLQAHYDRAGLPFNEARQRMACIPDGATLIDNPISTAPGFTLGNVHVMAGVPNIFQAMVASVLPGLTGGFATGMISSKL